MANQVVWFEVTGPDGPALQRFYSETFGWEIDSSNPMGYGVVEGDEGSVGGGVGGTQEGGSGHATFYIGVDDPQAFLDKIEAAGGRTVLPVTEIPDMATFALFTDPQGNLVGLVKA
jgi:uncharacterized protein